MHLCDALVGVHGGSRMRQEKACSVLRLWYRLTRNVARTSWAWFMSVLTMQIETCCATKAAERSISDGLRIDLNGTPIRVTSIDPGLVETEFSNVRFHGDDARANKVYEGLEPLMGEDIADAIVWSVSRPSHVEIQSILITPTAQANPFVLHRVAKT